MKQYLQQLSLTILLVLLTCCLGAQDTIPFDSTEKKLDQLAKLIGKKRIVAIGEDTHGTREFYQFREALTKKLIREKGFNVFILENPHEDILALEEGLKKENLDTLMKRHLFSIYQTEEMKSFLSWLKTTNQSIRLAGCDDSYREILPEKIRQETGKYHIPVLDSLVNDFMYRQTLSISKYYQLPGHQTNKLPNDLQYGYDAYVTVLKMDSVIRAKKISNRRLQELVFHARSNYEFYRAMKNKQYASRDSLMGARINWFAADKNNKIIIWAHNAHITRKSLNEEIGKMGETVNIQNPGQYFAIGLATAAGSYSYIKNNFINNDHHFSDTLFNADLLPMKEGSWHDHLRTAAPGNYYIHLSKLNKRHTEFYDKVKPFRAIGYKLENPERVYFSAALRPLFDLLVFYHSTHATTQIGSK
jgi:erythromycin esterase